MTIKSRKFSKGIRTKPTTDAATLEGEQRTDSAVDKQKIYLGGSERAVVTEDQAATLTNKTIDVDNNTITNIETDNLKAGVLVTDISAASSDTELPSALAVKTALAGQNEASEITYDNSTSGLTATDVQAAVDEVEGRVDTVESLASANASGLVDHLADTVDAHDASAISNVPSGNLVATEVQAALNELQTDVDTRALDSALSDHLNDTVDAHDASAVSYDNASSGLTAIEVQAAIDEVEARLDTTEGVATGAAADLTTHESDTSTHGVAGAIVGTTDVQIITLKDINGGTATDTSRLTAPKATKTVLDALTRKEATLVYASDEKTLYVDDGATLQPVGAGGGGGLDSFYTEDFEGVIGSSDFSTGNNATFDNGGSFNGVFTNTTSSNISGDTSIIYTQASSSLNDWVKSTTIVIDKKQQGNTVGLTLYYTYSGNSDDIKIVGYDNTGAEVMTLDSNLIKASSSAQRLSVEFPVPSDSTSISWGFQTVVENIGAVLVVDDIEISTDPFVYKNLLISQDYHLSQVTSALTNATAEVEFNLGSATIVNTGSSLIVAEDDSGNTRTKFVAQKACTIDISFSSQGSTGNPHVIYKNGTEIITGSAVYTGNEEGGVAATITLEATEFFTVGSLGLIPTSGQNAYLQFVATAESENVIAYNSRNAENLEVVGESNGGTALTANVTNIDWTEVTDAGFGNSNWSGSVFTVPEKGIYHFDGSVRFSTSTSNRVDIYINNVNKGIVGRANTSAVYMISALRNLNKDDTVSFRCSASLTLLAGTTLHVLNIAKIGVGDLLGVPVPRTCYIKDVKASGTAGGTFTSGAWQTRDLNDLSGDTEFVSLSSNQFVLQPGKYEIEASTLANKTNHHKVKLRNITDSSDAIIGTSSESASGENSTSSTGLVGVVIITGTKTFEIQHRAQTTRATDGFGVASAFSVDEVYLQVKITKVTD